MSKGSNQRPTDSQKFSAGYDLAFGRKNEFPKFTNINNYYKNVILVPEFGSCDGNMLRSSAGAPTQLAHSDSDCEPHDNAL